jgi:hypothetical protein
MSSRFRQIAKRGPFLVRRMSTCASFLAETVAGMSNTQNALADTWGPTLTMEEGQSQSADTEPAPQELNLPY